MVAVNIDDVYIVADGEDEFFDGPKAGDFSLLDWNVTGEQEWDVDGTKPYEGLFSAHVRADGISASGQFTKLDLDIDLAAAAFVQVYFYTPGSDQFERFELRVDGQSAWLDKVAHRPSSRPGSRETLRHGPKDQHRRQRERAEHRHHH